MALASTARQLATTATRHLVRVPAALVGGALHLAGAVQQRTGSSADNAAEALRERAEQPDSVIDLDAARQEQPGEDRDGRAMPFPAYDTLTGDTVMRHVRDSDDVEHLRDIQAFERAHKARKGVLQALDQRLTQLV